MIDAAAIRHKPLYCAFIDFSKAYDRVDRQLLYACLRSHGLHGFALEAVMGMYEDVRMQVRVGGELAEPFPSEVGVRQGDPLSPLLFGLVIDRLEGFITERCGESGVGLAEQIVRDLLYADDVALPASSPEALQSMLDCLHEFCVANSMFVNMSKSAVVVFNRAMCKRNDSARKPKVMYNGQSLEVRDSYTYLGVEFFSDKSVASSAPGKVLEKARKTLFAMYGRCAVLGIHNVCLQCQLFDSLVASVASYGCEVWAPDLVSGLLDKRRGLCDGVMEERLHRPFMRKVLGVCKATPVTAMMYELDRLPLSIHWLTMVMNFWNRAARRPCDDYLYAAMVENVRLACDASIRLSVKKRLWSFHFLRCMQQFGIECVGDDGLPIVIDMKVAVESIRQHWMRHAWSAMEDLQGAWLEEPCAVRRAPEGMKGFKLFTYDRWFAFDKSKHHRYTYHLNRYDHIRVMAQFRLGSHWLQIQQGRTRGQPRSQRVCPHCESGQVEDEMHVMTCPRYAGLRDAYGIGALDEMTDDCMRGKMHRNTPDEWVALADYLLCCRAIRVSSTGS